MKKLVEKKLEEYVKINEELERLNRTKNQLKAEIASYLDSKKLEELETPNFLITYKIVVRKSYVVPEIIYKDLRVKKK